MFGYINVFQIYMDERSTYFLYKLENLHAVELFANSVEGILYIVSLKFQTQTYRRHAEALMANTKPKEYLVNE